MRTIPYYTAQNCRAGPFTDKHVLPPTQQLPKSPVLPKIAGIELFNLDSLAIPGDSGNINCQEAA